MPSPLYRLLKAAYRTVHRGVREGAAKLGWNVYPTRDFYSPLPVFSEVRSTRHLWDRPSEMVGVAYDLDTMEELVRGLASRWAGAYGTLPSYEEIKTKGFGPGFTVIDGMLLYFMVRDLKPKRYIEVGSGFSTYYSWLATEKNRHDGAACEFGVVDPFPRAKMRELAGVAVRAQIVQIIADSWRKEGAVAALCDMIIPSGARDGRAEVRLIALTALNQAALLENDRSAQQTIIWAAMTAFR